MLLLAIVPKSDHQGRTRNTHTKAEADEDLISIYAFWRVVAVSEGRKKAVANGLERERYDQSVCCPIVFSREAACQECADRTTR